MKKALIVLVILISYFENLNAQHFDTSQYIFFNYDSVGGYFQSNFPYRSVRSYLSDSEFHQVEILLNKCILTYNISKEEEINKIRKTDSEIRLEDNMIVLKKYKQQFIVAVTPQGDKVAWINCFCDDFPTTGFNWKEDIPQVSDGGHCFFELNVNLTKNNYYNFHVHGM